MESRKLPSSIQLRPLVTTLVLLSCLAIATCDIDKDKEKCANDLVGLAPCLSYVSGQSKSGAPPPGCCSGLKQVLQKSPECICLLVKDRNDPSVPFKINSTLALSLPSQCHSPANVSDCPAVLHLPPNSPDAKVFEDFANSGKKGNSSSDAPPTAGNPAGAGAGGAMTGASITSGNLNSGAGKPKRSWAGIEVVSGLLLVTMAVLMLD